MDIFHFLQQQLPPSVLNVLRLTIWLLLLAVIFTPLEWLWGIRRQKLFRKDFFIDAGYYLINGIVPKLMLALPAAWLAVAMGAIGSGRNTRLGR